MARGHEEALTNQAGRRRGTLREMPTASSLVAAMSVEELRLYSQILSEISLETLDSTASSTVRKAENAIYFTWEQFVVWLRLPIP